MVSAHPQRGVPLGALPRPGASSSTPPRPPAMQGNHVTFASNIQSRPAPPSPSPADSTTAPYSVPSVQPMRVVMYSAMPYEIEAFDEELRHTAACSAIQMVYVSSSLDTSTASLALGSAAVCLFATDHADHAVLQTLRGCGVQLLALRYSGPTYFDSHYAFQLGMRIARTPKTAPTSIAEYAVALLMTLNRNIHVAHNRVRDGNFSLHGLVGFEIAGKTVGIVGTGQVGTLLARILSGYGCNVLAFDVVESQEALLVGARYVSINQLLSSSDIISLHAPLTPGTKHLIGFDTLSICKKGVLIVNTARGGLVQVPAVIEGLRTGQIGGIAMDVYEGEASVFFRDRTGEVIDMDLQMLKSMPNVLITGHQSAMTREAISIAAKATVASVLQFEKGVTMDYELEPRRFATSRGGG